MTRLEKNIINYNKKILSNVQELNVILYTQLYIAIGFIYIL